MTRPVQAAAREPEPPKGFRISTLARSLEIPRSSIYKLIRDGKLHAIRFSASGLIVLQSDLEEFLRANRTEPRR